jgi:CDP-diacylglycerol--glycerol-3-phosphate 3-phosphatidyltransferase
MELRRLTVLPEPLKKAFLDGIDPIADGLIKAGLSPNRITTISIFLICAAGVAFAMDSLHIGGAMLLLSGLFDLLDGKVARRAGQSSRFGAFYDSVMDRFGEGMLFAGIAIFYMTSAIYSFGNRKPGLALGLCFACLIASFLVSYTRARAEGLGIEAKVGMAQRAERIVFLGGSTLFFGAGPHGWLLLGILAWLTIIGWVTVGQRIYHVYSVTKNDAAMPPELRRVTDPPSGALPPPAPALPEPVVKGR